MGLPNGSDRSARRVASGVLVCSIAAVLALVAAVPLLAGTALAIDQVAILTPSPTDVEAEPGEEFEVVVGIVADGHGDDGVAAVDLVAQFHPDYLEVRDFESGPWLEEAGEETAVETTDTVANPDGTAILEQRRDPVASGAAGEGDLATLAVAVAEDAEPGETEIDFEGSDVEPAGDWPMPVHAGDVTVSIDGSDEPVEPFDHPDPDPGALETDGDESDATTDERENETTANGESADDGDPIPNGSVTTTILTGAIVLAYAAYRRL